MLSPFVWTRILLNLSCVQYYRANRVFPSCFKRLQRQREQEVNSKPNDERRKTDEIGAYPSHPTRHIRHNPIRILRIPSYCKLTECLQRPSSCLVPLWTRYAPSGAPRWCSERRARALRLESRSAYPHCASRTTSKVSKPGSWASASQAACSTTNGCPRRKSAHIDSHLRHQLDGHFRDSKPKGVAAVNEWLSAYSLNVAGFFFRRPDWIRLYTITSHAKLPIPE
ncbi:hypothetical protein EDB87DRAFT_796866 [Lactarius vividus]|nr:hypothetical protein EDB87DRAFT_796866 [Lactarius vividus]